MCSKWPFSSRGDGFKKLNELLTSVCCPQKQTGKYKHDLEAKLIIPAQRKHSLEENHIRDLGLKNTDWTRNSEGDRIQ